MALARTDDVNCRNEVKLGTVAIRRAGRGQLCLAAPEVIQATVNKTLTGIFVAAAAALSLSAFAPMTANAADVGFCATPAKMTEVLKAEGQRSLAFGNQRILFEEQPDGSTKSVDKQIGLIFTAGKFDRNGIAQTGYVIQADQPIGTLASKMCVADRMQDVKMYDVRKPELPAETLIQSTPEAAAKKCDELAAKGVITRDGCSFHNDAMKNLAKVGERVMMQGLGVKKQNDGSYIPDGTLITVTANMANNKTSRDGRGMIHYSALPDGASLLARIFTGTNYTQTALSELPSVK